MDITKESVLITLGLLGSIGLLIIAMRKGIDFNDFSFIKLWNGKHSKTNGAYEFAEFLIGISIVIFAIALNFF